jgi:hypothetical protein
MEVDVVKLLWVFGAMVFGISVVFNVYAFTNRKKREKHYQKDLGLTLSQSEQVSLQFDHDRNFRQTNVIEEDDDEDLEDKISVKVAIFNGKAYWITEEGFNTAPVDEDEEVIYSLTEPVDTSDMSQDELETLLEIVDALKEDR